jgi:hypothetical protein
MSCLFGWLDFNDTTHVHKVSVEQAHQFLIGTDNGEVCSNLDQKVWLLFIFPDPTSPFLFFILKNIPKHRKTFPQKDVHHSVTYTRKTSKTFCIQ